MKIFPVVHINEVSTAVEQGEKAFEAGADGVFLIDHHNGSADTDQVFNAFNILRSADKKRPVGINILGLGGLNALRIVDSALSSGQLESAPYALWYDDARRGLHPGDVKRFRRETPSVGEVRLMGGVAFKYTRYETDDAELAYIEAAELADSLDIVTTSGSGTGTPPSVEKIASMRRAIGDQELAIASGINAANIRSFGPYVDYALVSTSIETRPHSGVFDVVAMTVLIERAHELAR